jgi:hypothetical protein
MNRSAPPFAVHPSSEIVVHELPTDRQRVAVELPTTPPIELLVTLAGGGTSAQWIDSEGFATIGDA